MVVILNTPEISSILFANTGAVSLVPAKGHIGLLITNYVIQPVTFSFNSSLPWKYIPSYVHILEFFTRFYP